MNWFTWALLSALFAGLTAVLEHMLARGSGRIVNISSAIGETGNIGQANYAASKSGLFGFTKSLALETARKGITVNCVVPGGFATDMLDAMSLTDRSAVERSIPIGRYGRPPELAHVVASLLHDDASYVTGAIIAADGGRTAT